MKLQVKSFLLFVTLFLSSCVSLGPETREPALTPEKIKEEMKVEKFIGVIEEIVPEEPFPAEAGQPRTDKPLAPSYLLQRENETPLSIASELLQLQKYVKRRVEIDGNWADESKTLFVVSDITKLGNEESIKTTYKSTELGFTLEHPFVWAWKEKADGLELTPYDVSAAESIDRITVTRLSNEKKLPLLEWQNLDLNYKPRDPSDLNTYQQSFIGTQKLEGVKKTSEGAKRVDFYVSRDASVYRLSFLTSGGEEEEKHRNVFFDLVLSFQFLAYSPTEKKVEEKSQVSKKTETKKEEVKAPEPEKPKPPEKKPEQVGTSTSLVSGTSTSEIAIQDQVPEGYTLLEIKWLKISLTYPKRWFWSCSNKEFLCGFGSTLEAAEAGDIRLIRKMEKSTSDWCTSDFCFELGPGGGYAGVSMTIESMLKSIQALP